MAGSMRERRPGVWELRVSKGRDLSQQGVKYRYLSETFHGTEAAARRRLHRLAVEVEDGKHSAASATFSDLLDDWLEASPNLSPTTRAEYERIVTKTLKPALGSKRITQLEPKDFDDLYRALGTRAVKPLKPRSIGQIHAVSRRALNQAVRWRWLTYNPAALAQPPTVHKAQVKPPSLEGLGSVLAAAARQDPEMAVLLAVASCVGARRGELCGLQWRDIDHKRRVITISRAVVEVKGRVTVKDTKTHAEREVAMDEVTSLILTGLRSRVEERAAFVGRTIGPESFVFSSSPTGNTPPRPDAVTKAFMRAAREAGVRARLHDLRHLSVSLLLEAGVPLAEVSGRAGHAKQSTTTDIYNAQMPGARLAAPGIINSVLGPVIHQALQTAEDASSVSRPSNSEQGAG